MSDGSFNFISKRPQLIIFFLLATMLFWVTAASNARSETKRSMLQGSHGNKQLLPRQCQACHRGMTMYISGEEKPCLNCHGNSTQRTEMVQKNYLHGGKAAQLKDVEIELRKEYNHPVLQIGGVHRSYEILPEETSNAQRHSECVDCHNPHLTDANRPYAGLSGRRVGNLIVEIEKEYELCYRCHSTSANLTSASTNKADEFRTTGNASFHPVEGEGRLAFVISLKKPYVARKQRPNDVSMITCSDCHGSDNPNAPKGPHGSNFRGLLKRHYEMEDNYPESEYAYALCYNCHDRNSILGNESFPFHEDHIRGNLTSRRLGTSCFTCHDAHGSALNPYLIRFNEMVVQPNTEGTLEYKQIGVAARHGSCSLTCHGVEHKEKTY